MSDPHLPYLCRLDFYFHFIQRKFLQRESLQNEGRSIALQLNFCDILEKISHILFVVIFSVACANDSPIKSLG